MIKIKRKCDSKECKNPHFAKGFCKNHQYKRPDFKKPEFKKTPIKQKSEKTRVAGLMYTRKRNAFMKLKENQICPVASFFLKHPETKGRDLIEWSQSINAVEVHHKGGRVGKLLNDQSLWLAVSRKGHNYIHDNPEESYSRGWLVKSTTV